MDVVKLSRTDTVRLTSRDEDPAVELLRPMSVSVSSGKPEILGAVVESVGETTLLVLRPVEEETEG